MGDDEQEPEISTAGASPGPLPPSSPSHSLTLSPAHILFEEPHLLVVNKPAPLLTQAPPGVPSLEALAKAYIKAK